MERDDERYSGRFCVRQLRTLQRLLHAWRVRSGPEREVFSPQVHVPGEQAQSDFTDMRELGITNADETFAHLPVNDRSWPIMENSP